MSWFTDFLLCANRSTRDRRGDAVVARRRTLSQVGKFAQLLQTIDRQRMSEVEQQGRRAVLVYY